MPKLNSATYHLDIKTAEFVADNGDHLLRSGGTPAWRFNNPGNMRPPHRRVVTTNIGTATMADGNRFLIFPDYDTGRAELKRLLRDPGSYAQRTVADAIPKFAPKQDSNNPDKYMAFVEKKAGISRTDKLGDLTDAQLNKVIDSIETFEGYHYLSETRSEKWVKAAAVTLSDGARPIAGQPVVVRQNGKETTHVTDAAGQLPAIPHKGGQIEILSADSHGKLDAITRIAQQDASKAYLFVRNLFVAQASTASHAPPKQAAKPERHSFTYRIEPNDTLSKIAQRFKTTVEKLKSDNHLTSDLIIVGKTLSIYGEGPASGRAGSHAARHHATPLPGAQSSPSTRTDPPVAMQSADPANKASSAETSGNAAASDGTGVAMTVPSEDAASPIAVQHPANGTAAADSRPTPAADTSNADTSESTLPLAPAVASSAAAVPGRSQDGQGRPLGLVPLAQPRATWMAIAIREGERWGGADESVITKTMNYHDLVDNKNWIKTLVGSKQAWCAAFVNWVMKQDGRNMVEKRDDRHRARKFVGDPNFPEIKIPIFGAIAVERNLGHVMFIYGINPKNGNLVVLGGNQGGGGTFGGTIDFSEFKKSQIHGYYVPVTYLAFANEEIKRGAQLPETMAAEMNRLCNIKEPKGHGTR